MINQDFFDINFSPESPHVTKTLKATYSLSVVAGICLVILGSLALSKCISPAGAFGLYLSKIDSIKAATVISCGAFILVVATVTILKIRKRQNEANAEQAVQNNLQDQEAEQLIPAVNPLPAANEQQVQAQVLAPQNLVQVINPLSLTPVMPQIATPAQKRARLSAKLNGCKHWGRFKTVPMDLLRRISGYLQFKEVVNLKNILVSNEAWIHFVEWQREKGSIDDRDGWPFSQVQWDASFQRFNEGLFASEDWLKSLSLSKVNAIQLTELFPDVQMPRFPLLERLELTFHREGFNDEARLVPLSLIGRNCPNLKELAVSKLNEEECVLVLRDCHKITSFEFGQYSNRRFIGDGIHEWQWNSLPQTFLTKRNHLKSIKFYEPCRADKFPIVANIHYLKRIHINGTGTYIFDNSLIAFRQHPHLKEVILESLDITNDSLIMLAASLTKLITLRIENCPNIDAVGIAAFTIQPRLKELVLDKFDDTDDAMKALIKCTTLTTLRLLRCDDLSNEGLGYISQFSKLQYLEILKGSKYITDRGLAQLKLSPIRTLSLGATGYDHLKYPFQKKKWKNVTYQGVVQFMGSKIKVICRI